MNENVNLSILCGLGLVGLFVLAYVPPAENIFNAMLPILSGLVGGAFSALYRAMGVANGPPVQWNNNVGPKLPGT